MQNPEIMDMFLRKIAENFGQKGKSTQKYRISKFKLKKEPQLPWRWSPSTGESSDRQDSWTHMKFSTVTKFNPIKIEIEYRACKI